MGKNFKEQASYDLLHNKRAQSTKLECIVRKKWCRHNFHWGWYKKYRNILKEKIFDKLNNS